MIYIPTSIAVDRVAESLKEDKEFYNTWKSNLVMAFKDTVINYSPEANFDHELLHEFSNKAADKFLKQLIA